MPQYKTKVISHSFEDNRCEDSPSNCWFIGRAEIRNGAKWIKSDFQIDATATQDL